MSSRLSLPCGPSGIASDSYISDSCCPMNKKTSYFNWFLFLFPRLSLSALSLLPLSSLLLLLLHPSLPPSSSPASLSPPSSSLISLTSHCLTVRHHLPHLGTPYPLIGLCDQAERQCGKDMWIHLGIPCHLGTSAAGLCPYPRTEQVTS